MNNHPHTQITHKLQASISEEGDTLTLTLNVLEDNNQKLLSFYANINKTNIPSSIPQGYTNIKVLQKYLEKKEPYAFDCKTQILEIKFFSSKEGIEKKVIVQIQMSLSADSLME